MTTGASAVINYCPSGASGVCYAVGVPPSTASKGSGNIYFRITAPTSYQWVALGTGTMMAGSNMFIMYQDGKGNVTLSPRLGTFHTMPTLNTGSNAPQLTLLAGSGVSGTTMTANVVCANCESWGTSGKLSVTSTSAPWIGAWRAGSSLATTNKNAALTQHDNTAQYQLDLTKATISSDSNPFVSQSSGNGGSNGGSGSGSGSGGSNGGSSGSGNNGGGTTPGSSPNNGGGGVTVVSSGKPSSMVLAAHGIIMALVMVVLYPLGASLMPLLGKWYIHGIWQGLAYLLMWAGFALGVRTAQQRGLLFAGPGNTHTVLGTVTVAALGIQPFLGLLHHHLFKRTGGRTYVSHAHIWWGRVFMIIGIVNGGLGLKLASASHSLIVAYAVTSAVLFVAYIVAKAVGSLFLRRRAGKASRRSEPTVSGNGRRYDEPRHQARGGDDNGYRNEQQQQQQYKGSGGRDGSGSTYDYASQSPPQPVPMRDLGRQPASGPPPGDNEQNRSRMQREQQRYAY
ncbi:integral membrane protein [Niveomyces insectorum RCEF 264]|uniref:Integral membrane protein n=1 Tax=Niveomyces insectorum RCEF 264 TaxID=1081102 RepID=A0A168A0A0_9HYPO|nr:integral membrane protein [Niveomyces insectorum RCEF 264]